jgi:predicted AAA+ superfamily ATPase
MEDVFLNRTIENRIFSELQREDSKIIVIYGARQVGKTTLVQSILDKTDKKVLKINGDRIGNHKDISSRDFEKLEALVNGIDILFIDEAQRIPEIGINLKILYDHFKGALKIIVTGSSALDLSSSVKEALTGRKKQFTLYPISFLELKTQHTNFELYQKLEERMIFGGYPQALNIQNRQERIDYISELTEDYLYKDILEIENIRYHTKLRDLLTLLAFQVGSEVSLSELGSQLGLGKDTVARYIDLLEQSFVLFRLGGFSRNLRKEVNKKPKIYFYDLGVRNAIIGNFNYLNARNDVGALWENFLILERIKRNSYTRHYCNKYFWRTYTGAELDYVEEYNGELHGYEFKYTKTAKAPKTWIETYKQEKASFEYVNRDNFLKFVLGNESE